MIDLLYPVFLGIFDRVRGSEFNLFGNLRNNRTYEKAVLGYITAASLGHWFDYLTLPLLILVGIGMSLGWGEPLGAALNRRQMNIYNLEDWQIGITRSNVWAALTLRGIIWGSFSLPLAYFDPMVAILVLAYAIGFPLSAYVARDASRYVGYEAWGLSEFLRSFFAGWIILGGMYAAGN